MGPTQSLIHQFTVCVSEAELPTKTLLPLYVAVMLSVPAGSAEVLNVTAPSVRDRVFSAVVPLKKVTVPVAVPLNCGATLAVKVTGCPEFDGFGEETSVVVVVASPTT